VRGTDLLHHVSLILLNLHANPPPGIPDDVFVHDITEAVEYRGVRCVSCCLAVELIAWSHSVLQAAPTQPCVASWMIQGMLFVAAHPLPLPHSPVAAWQDEYDLATDICDMAAGGQILMGPKTYQR
jgi:hypothetical protein